LELQAVSELAARETTCWYPDGTLRCGKATSWPAASNPSPAGREIILCLGGNWTPRSDAEMHFECFAGSGGHEYPCSTARSILERTNRIIVMPVPAAATVARLRIGLPETRWEDTDASWEWNGDAGALRRKSIRKGEEDWEVTVSGVQVSPQGLTVVLLSHIHRNGTGRLVAMDRDDRLHQPDGLAPQGSHGPNYNARLVGWLVPRRMFFPGLSLQGLKELRFQFCPYRWIEFRNISLRAGHQTEVEVLSEDKRLQTSGTPTGSAVPPKPPVSAAALAEPPKLRFLAWQDENPEWKTWTNAWRADGKRAGTREEQLLLGLVSPARIDLSGTKDGRGRRVLLVWFSHPALSPNSHCQLALKDPTGRTIRGDAGHSYQMPEGNIYGGGRNLPRDGGDDGSEPVFVQSDEGWFVAYFVPARDESIPASATLTLRYSVGAWEFPGITLARDSFAGGVTGTTWGTISWTGETADGRAFVTLTGDSTQFPNLQVDFEAETMAGKVMEPLGTDDSGPPEMRTRRFIFPVHLRELKEYRLRTRSVRTVEFRDIALQPR
jgi:hypothetical protein